MTADEASVFLALSSLGFIDDTDEQEWNSILQEFTEARNANTGELFGQILKVSKTLSWMLRHGPAADTDISNATYPGGGMSVVSLVRRFELVPQSHTFLNKYGDLGHYLFYLALVATDPKERFILIVKQSAHTAMKSDVSETFQQTKKSVESKAAPDTVWNCPTTLVAACQGHSFHIPVELSHLRAVTEEQVDELGVVFHGTSVVNKDKILLAEFRPTLLRMGRTHVHFYSTHEMATREMTISTLRASSREWCFYFVGIREWIQAGFPVYKAINGVILTDRDVPLSSEFIANRSQVVYLRSSKMFPTPRLFSRQHQTKFAGASSQSSSAHKRTSADTSMKPDVAETFQQTKKSVESNDADEIKNSDQRKSFRQTGMFGNKAAPDCKAPPAPSKARPSSKPTPSSVKKTTSDRSSQSEGEPTHKVKFARFQPPFVPGSSSGSKPQDATKGPKDRKPLPRKRPQATDSSIVEEKGLFEQTLPSDEFKDKIFKAYWWRWLNGAQRQQVKSMGIDNADDWHLHYLSGVLPAILGRLWYSAKTIIKTGQRPLIDFLKCQEAQRNDTRLDTVLNCQFLDGLMKPIEDILVVLIKKYQGERTLNALPIRRIVVLRFIMAGLKHTGKEQPLLFVRYFYWLDEQIGWYTPAGPQRLFISDDPYPVSDAEHDAREDWFVFTGAKTMPNYKIKVVDGEKAGPPTVDPRDVDPRDVFFVDIQGNPIDDLPTSELVSQLESVDTSMDDAFEVDYDADPTDVQIRSIPMPRCIPMPVNNRSFPQLPFEQSQELSPATKKHKPGHDQLTEPASCTGMDVDADEELLAGDEVPENVVGGVAEDDINPPLARIQASTGIDADDELLKGDQVTQNVVGGVTEDDINPPVARIQASTGIDADEELLKGDEVPQNVVGGVTEADIKASVAKILEGIESERKQNIKMFLAHHTSEHQSEARTANLLRARLVQPGNEPHKHSNLVPRKFWDGVQTSGLFSEVATGVQLLVSQMASRNFPTDYVVGFDDLRCLDKDGKPLLPRQVLAYAVEKEKTLKEEPDMATNADLESRGFPSIGSGQSKTTQQSESSKQSETSQQIKKSEESKQQTSVAPSPTSTSQLGFLFACCGFAADYQKADADRFLNYVTRTGNHIIGIIESQAISDREELKAAFAKGKYKLHFTSSHDMMIGIRSEDDDGATSPIKLLVDSTANEDLQQNTCPAADIKYAIWELDMGIDVRRTAKHCASRFKTRAGLQLVRVLLFQIDKTSAKDRPCATVSALQYMWRDAVEYEVDVIAGDAQETATWFIREKQPYWDPNLSAFTKVGRLYQKALNTQIQQRFQNLKFGLQIQFMSNNPAQLLAKTLEVVSNQFLSTQTCDESIPDEFDCMVCGILSWGHSTVQNLSRFESNNTNNTSEPCSNPSGLFSDFQVQLSEHSLRFSHKHLWFGTNDPALRRPMTVCIRVKHRRKTTKRTERIVRRRGQVFDVNRAPSPTDQPIGEHHRPFNMLLVHPY